MTGTFRRGFSIIELVIVLLVFTLLLIPTAAYFRKYQQSLLLDSHAKKIIEAVRLARTYAINERKEFYVIIVDEGFVIRRENNDIVGKEHKFHNSIRVHERTAGFDPVILRSDGTSKIAGNMTIVDINTGKEKRIVLHNLSGRCFVKD